MTLELVEKRCPDCGEVKSLTEFHRNAKIKDGRHTYCKPCAIVRQKQYAAKARAEMGEAAWLAEKRYAVNRSRSKNGMKRERQYGRAKTIAVQGLIDAHREEFEARMRLALDAVERES